MARRAGCSTRARASWSLRRDVPAESRFGIEGLEERCDVVLGDLVDYESLVRALNEYEVKAVFHLGAQTIVGTANRSPLSTYETNIRGTYLLLEACRAVGVVGDGIERVVVASSDKAYGSHDELPYSEDFALQPRYPYDVSKAATDMIARSYAVTYGLPVAVTRLANVYGGGDFNFSRIVPDTARALVRGDRPVIRSDGTPERDYIYARRRRRRLPRDRAVARRPGDARAGLERRRGAALLGQRDRRAG